MDTENGGDLDVAETAAEVSTEDREYDTLEDAAAAIRDDDDETSDDEQPDEPEDEPEEGEAEGDEDSEAEDADDDQDEEVEDGDAVVQLPGGEEITVSELEQWRANGLRQADYTQKTQELARQRQEVEQQASQYAERLQFAENALQNLTENLQSLIPEEPPLQLAYSDPNEYQKQQAMRQHAMKEVQGWLQAKQQVDEHKQQTTEQERQKYVQAEQEKLAKAMPHLSDPARKAAFDKAVKETAAEFGFGEDEIANTHDSRVLQLVHYARMGKRAEQNRNNAKRRVETPKKGKAKPSQQTAQQTNRKAMQRLSQTGSIEDALKIPFD